MLLKKIYDRIDGIAPFALSREECEKFGHYDNSGVMLDCGGEIGKLLFSLDLSAAAVREAKRVGANAVVTHHSAIYAPLRSLTEEEGRNVLACARAGISVLSAHLNLDCAEGGIDECLMEGLGGRRALAIMEELSCGGYGRVFEREKTKLSSFVSEIGRTFGTERVICYGEREVKRVASFCGAGLDEKSLSFALKEGADTIVSSDAKHHLLAEGIERGVNLVLLTHYASESYGFFRFYERCKRAIELPCEYFDDHLIK